MVATKTLTLVLFLFAISLSRIRAQTAEEEAAAFEALQISWNPRALTRSARVPKVLPTPHPVDGATTLSKDIFIYPDYNVWPTGHTWEGHVRLYIPVVPPTNGTKLSLIVYLHGGYFILESATHEPFHTFCNDIAAQFPAVVVSVEYSLAPETPNGLTNFEATEVLRWARKQALRQGMDAGGRDPWMEYADFSRVYLLGSSSGANIAYHTTIQSFGRALDPLQVRGVLLNQPYFGGVERTASEFRLINDTVLPLYINDVQWNLSLPLGVSRDNVYCNPTTHFYGDAAFARLEKVYIKSDYGDPLVDRALQLVQFLHSKRVPVFSRFNRGGFHGIEMKNRTVAQQLYNEMKWFINEADGNLQSAGDMSNHRDF